LADTDIIPFGAAIAGDVLSALSIPGGNTLGIFATNALAKKRREAAEILIREVSSGMHGAIEFEAHDIDPLIDIILRFSKAVAEGAARENLILLAQTIAGLKKYRALEADKFRKWSKIIEDLTRDELLVIGFAYRLEKQRPADREDDFNGDLRKAIKGAGYEDAELEALLTRVGSTGLLSSASAWGGLAYQPTGWLAELGKLADIEAASRSQTQT
jgi:hypothetical protein